MSVSPILLRLLIFFTSSFWGSDLSIFFFFVFGLVSAIFYFLFFIFIFFSFFFFLLELLWFLGWDSCISVILGFDGWCTR